MHDTTCSLSSLLALTPTILKPAVLNADGGFSGGSAGNNLPANAGDVGSIPGSRRSLEGGNGNLLQYSCLGNPSDTGLWLATVHGVTKESDTTQRVNAYYHKSFTSLMELGKSFPDIN